MLARAMFKCCSRTRRLVRIPPALVRQGQISELVNAKPKARRRVLEEAAGISGLYQRRHEAELKLNSTELNLTRVDDVLEQLASQLASLARQAKQAARYREIAEELRLAEGLLLFRRWSEADTHRQTADAALKEATVTAGQAQAAAASATTARLEAESTVPPLREEEAIAGAVLQRQIVAREAMDADEARAVSEAEALSGRITQLTGDKDREEALGNDAGEMIGTVELGERSALQGCRWSRCTLGRGSGNRKTRQRNASKRKKNSWTAAQKISQGQKRMHKRSIDATMRLNPLRAAQKDEAEKAEAVAQNTKAKLAEAGITFDRSKVGSRYGTSCIAHRRNSLDRSRRSPRQRAIGRS